MLALLFLWTSLDISWFIEGILLKWQSAVKHTTFLGKHYKSKYGLNDILFVDVSNEKTILTDSSSLRNLVVTDRNMLDSCFKMINITGGYKFVLCDIGFETPSPYDSSLAVTIHSMDHIGFPFDLSDIGNRQVRWLNSIPGGPVQYSYISNNEHLSDELLKFRLVAADGQKSLPLFMAESTEGIRLASKGDFLRFDHKSCYYLNNITVDCQIRSNDLLQTNEVSRLYTLTDFNSLLSYQDSKANQELIQNKIIVIGDFENDMHKTSIELMPGALILLNIFLSFVNAQNSVTFLWVLYLFTSFAILSYFSFYGAGKKVQKMIDSTEDWLVVLFGKALGKELINFGLLLVFSLVSYFLFDKTIEVIALSLWLTVVELVREGRMWFRNKPFTYRNFHGWLISNHKSQ